MNGTLNSSRSMGHQHGDGMRRATTSMGRASNQVKEGTRRVVVGVGGKNQHGEGTRRMTTYVGRAMTGVGRVDS